VDLHQFSSKSSGGNAYALIVIDVFSTFCLGLPLPDKSARTIALALWSIFSMFGAPGVLQSDNGSEFSNEVLADLARRMRIEQRFAMVYKPSSNGLVERRIGSVASCVRKMTEESLEEWDVMLPAAILAHNRRVNPGTGVTPFHLFFCRHPRPLARGGEVGEFVPRDQEGSGEGGESATEAWLRHVRAMMRTLRPDVLARREAQRARTRRVQDREYGRRSRVVKAFPVGSKVMIASPVRASKDVARFFGPYTVARALEDGNYELSDKDSGLETVRRHHSQLRPCGAALESDVYYVEEILQHAEEGKELYFRVKWMGFPLSEATWEPASSLPRALIEAYQGVAPQDLEAGQEMRGGGRAGVSEVASGRSNASAFARELSSFSFFPRGVSASQ